MLADLSAAHRSEPNGADSSMPASVANSEQSESSRSSNHGPSWSDCARCLDESKQGHQPMGKHVAISPTEAADRLAIRELIEAYAHCADRRDAKGQLSLFTPDTHFVVYMNAKDPRPSQAAFARGARASVRRIEQIRRHHALRRAEHHLHADRGSRHGRSLLPGASRDCRR